MNRSFFLPHLTLIHLYRQLALGNTLVLSEKGITKTKEDEIVINSFKEELEVIEELGKGTSGVVYKTKHKPSGKIIAVKVVFLAKLVF